MNVARLLRSGALLVADCRAGDKALLRALSHTPEERDTW